MAKKNHSARPANLSSKQKEVLKAEILCQFPNLSIMDSMVDELIDAYSKDKNYLKKLQPDTPNTDERTLLEIRKAELEKHIESLNIQPITTAKQGTPEWQEIIDKMEAAKKQTFTVEQVDAEQKAKPDTEIEISNDKEIVTDVSSPEQLHSPEHTEA